MWEKGDLWDLHMLTICSMVIVIVLQPQQSAGAGSCPAGWFGENCTYLCHCFNNGSTPVTCHQTTGECPASTGCETDFFGVGCQYGDGFRAFKSNEVPNFLWARDLTTCNNNTNLTHLFFTFNLSIHFSMCRIHTKTDMSNHALTLVLGDNETCSNQRTYRVSENILDVSCDTTKTYSKFYLKGAVVAQICGMSINLGRNVGLRQTATQSSDASYLNFNYSAGLAVDGFKSNRSLLGRTCSSTDSKGNPWWTLLYSHPQKLFLVILFNADKSQAQLMGFSLELYALPNDTKSVFKYKDGATRPESTYVVYIPPLKSPVTFLNISTSGRASTDSEMYLCEVETYGETVCPEGKYGFDCQLTCNCGPKETCHPSTGTCAPPCKSDPAATDCSYQCHPNCNSKLCQEGDCAACVASECSSCKPGFSGPYCDDACPKGKYGDKCAKSCSKYCKGSTCNALTGHCEACVGNQDMPMCEEKEDDKGGGGSGEGKKVAEGFNILFVLPLLLLLPIAMCLLCCFMRRHKTLAPAAEAKPPETEAVVPEQAPTKEPNVVVESGSAVDTGEGSAADANVTASNAASTTTAASNAASTTAGSRVA